ncbi:hypothetical protein Pmar_PMAR019361, partial [Perkinsus marinus ATCC 50983]
MFSLSHCARGMSRVRLAGVNGNNKKFVVPVGAEDTEGTAAAIKKAVELAQE